MDRWVSSLNPMKRELKAINVATGGGGATDVSSLNPMKRELKDIMDTVDATAKCVFQA